MFTILAITITIVLVVVVVAIVVVQSHCGTQRTQKGESMIMFRRQTNIVFRMPGFTHAKG